MSSYKRQLADQEVEAAVVGAEEDAELVAWQPDNLHATLEILELQHSSPTDLVPHLRRKSGQLVQLQGTLQSMEKLWPSVPRTLTYLGWTASGRCMTSTRSRAQRYTTGPLWVPMHPDPSSWESHLMTSLPPLQEPPRPSRTWPNSILLEWVPSGRPGT